jgi:hypothetical protein
LGEEGLLVFEGDAKVAYVRPWLYAIHYYGKRVEAEKPVPHVGTFWAGGASGATGYRTESKRVACCETLLVGPFGYVRTPETT